MLLRMEFDNNLIIFFRSPISADMMSPPAHLWNRRVIYSGYSGLSSVRGFSAADYWSNIRRPTAQPPDEENRPSTRYDFNFRLTHYKFKFRSENKLNIELKMNGS